MNNLPGSYHSYRRCKGPRLYCTLFARVSSFQHWPDRLQEYESEYISLGGRRNQGGSCCRGVCERLRVTVWELERCEKLTMYEEQKIEYNTTKHENDVLTRSAAP